MMRFKLSSTQRRLMPDLVAGLAVLVLMLGLTGWHAAIAMDLSGSSPVTRFDWNATAFLLVGAVLAMAIFNMAFFRHLARVSASHRKEMRRAQAKRPRG